MAEIPNLSKSIIGVIDEVDQILGIQELLRVCQDEFNAPDENSLRRLQLLIDCYLVRLEHHANELKVHLNRLQNCLKQIAALVESD